MSSWVGGFTDPATIGYPLLFGGVLLGSIVPVVPTGVVVGVAAAVATTTPHMHLALVLVVATLAALGGDVVTFAVCRSGGARAAQWVTRGQQAARLAVVRERFQRHGWQIIVVGRLVPAGRIPVLAAAGALHYPWRRLLPSALLAAALWAVAYAALGVVSGGLFDSPTLAVTVAAVLVLLVTVLVTLLGRWRTRRRLAAAPSVATATTAR